MSAFLNLTRIEAKLFARDRASFIMGLILPLGILLVLGAIPALREPSAEFANQRFVDFFAPSLIVLSVAGLGLNTLPTIMATYRERGVLRRMSTTPVHPGKLMGAQLVVNLVASTMSALLVVAGGALVFDVPLPRHPLEFALTFLLGVASVYSLGLLVAAVAPTTRAAGGIAALLSLVVMFFGGVYLPRFLLPEILVRIGDYTPPGVQSLLDSWTGTGPAVLPLVIMAATAVAAGVAATRFFRWE